MKSTFVNILFVIILFVEAGFGGYAIYKRSVELSELKQAAANLNAERLKLERDILSLRDDKRKMRNVSTARDLQRKSDLRNVATALNAYFTEMSGYPAVADYAALCAALVPKYMPTCPEDPLKSEGYVYVYTYEMPSADGGSSTGFALDAKLESQKAYRLCGGTFNAACSERVSE